MAAFIQMDQEIVRHIFGARHEKARAQLVGAVGLRGRHGKPEQAAVTPAPKASETKSAASQAKDKPKPKAAAQAPAKLALGQKININTDSKEQIELLPEIGSSKAQAIIAGRPYKKPEDLMKVKGIKEGTFNKIKDHITVQ